MSADELKITPPPPASGAEDGPNEVFHLGKRAGTRGLKLGEACARRHRYADSASRSCDTIASL